MPRDFDMGVLTHKLPLDLALESVDGGEHENQQPRTKHDAEGGKQGDHAGGDAAALGPEVLAGEEPFEGSHAEDKPKWQSLCSQAHSN